MTARQYVPFGGLWDMRIDVPYSFLVADSGFGWTCGQCPFDAEGRVLDPGDLAAQTERIADYITEVMGRGEFDPARIGKLVCYFVSDDPSDEETMTGILRGRFGDAPSIIPVVVPHFYYEGLRVEIEAHARPDAAGPIDRIDGDGIGLEMVEAGDLLWMAVSANADPDIDPAKVSAAVERALRTKGLGLRNLLADHWYIPGHLDGRFLAHGLHQEGVGVSLNGAVVTPPGRPLIGELTFARPPREINDLLPAEGVDIAVRGAGDWLWILGNCRRRDLDLLEQTRRIMARIETELAGKSATFAEVVKATTHYVGGASAEDLHENMAIRNARFEKPGPASTGVSVTGLADQRCQIAIDFLLRRTG